jgi:hypothetical protein
MRAPLIVSLAVVLAAASSAHAQNASDVPDAAARANWLPAPEGQFALIIRAYAPTQQILDGDYKFPDVKRRTSAG